MAVLFIANIDYPSNCGGGSHIFNIVKGIEEEGLDVYILTQNASLRDKGMNIVNGQKVINVDWPKTIVKLPSNMNSAFVTYILSLPSVFHALYDIYKIVSKYNIELIYERFAVPGGLGILAGRVLRIPVILEINDPFEIDDERIVYGHLKRINKKVQFGLAKTLIVLSPIMERAIKNQTRTKTELIPCGADTTLFVPIEKDIRLQKELGLEGKKLVCYLGSFRVYHGLGDLVEVYSTIRQEISDVALLIIGGSENAKEPELQEVIRRIREMDDVAWVGEISNTQIPRYLSLADVCVAPYNTKIDTFRRNAFLKYGLWGSPVKIFEYMAMAKPVVASDVGQIADYLEGAGLVYEENNLEDFLDKLKRIIDMSPEKRRELGLAGRRKVEEYFSWRFLAGRTYEVIRKVIEND